MERTRKVDVETLSDDQIKNIEDTLSNKIKDITNSAVQEANKYLNVYGLEALMVIQFKKKESESLE